MKIFDMAIIGAGPAGSAAALKLSGYGFDVCLIERKEFPRETICGEFFSEEAIRVLRGLNLYNDFLSLQPNRIKAVQFYNDKGEIIDRKLNFDAYGISRGKFDDFLLRSASQKGVKVFQPCEVKEIAQSGNGYTLSVKGGTDFSPIAAKKIICAYGRQNILDKLLKRKFYYYKSEFFAFKVHVGADILNKYETGTIKMFAADGIYCGLNPVSPDQASLCYLADSNITPGTAVEQLKILWRRNRSFGEHFREGSLDRISDFRVHGTGNIYFGKKDLMHGGIYFIGDSARMIAPLAGDGISMALESGFMIADILNKQSERHTNDRDTGEAYAHSWNYMFAGRLRAADWIQRAIMNKYTRNMAAKLLECFPVLLNPLINSTRG